MDTKTLPCCTPEPMPKACFGPDTKEFKEWLEKIGIIYLGDSILSPGAQFEYKVVSGPMCRFYSGNGYPEPHSFERAWVPKNDKGAWRKERDNYLSYLVDDGIEYTDRRNRAIAINPEREIKEVNYGSIPSTTATKTTAA